MNIGVAKGHRPDRRLRGNYNNAATGPFWLHAKWLAMRPRAGRRVAKGHFGPCQMVGNGPPGA